MKTRIRRIRFRIRYKRRSELVALVALVLLVPAFLGILAWSQKDAAAAPAAPAASAPLRKYYLQGYSFGDTALTACAPGYHMASLWEILDPSNLEYNTALGHTRDDSGAGPPTYFAGWVRTGWDSGTDVGVPGRDNCAAWTTRDPGTYGTTVYLPDNWTGGSEDLHVWAVGRYLCGLPGNVWCVENYPTSVYLPLVLRDSP